MGNPFALNPDVRSAMITAGVMLLTFALTQLFNLLYNCSQRKHETKVKFFYEMYPKRLAVYDEVDGALTEICQYAPKLTKLEKAKANEVIISDMYKLKRLCHKLSVYGSLETWQIIGDLFIHLRALSIEHTGLDLVPENGKEFKIADNVAIGAFALAAVAAINATHRVFTNSVRAETGENLIDKEIRDFLKKTVIGKNNKGIK